MEEITELNQDLIDFLDGHSFTKENLKDIQYIKDCVYNYDEAYLETLDEDEQAKLITKLAGDYVELKMSEFVEEGCTVSDLIDRLSKFNGNTKVYFTAVVEAENEESHAAKAHCSIIRKKDGWSWINGMAKDDDMFIEVKGDNLIITVAGPMTNLH